MSKTESKGHITLKKTIQRILHRSNFEKIDTEIDLAIRTGRIDRSLDVAAINKNYLLIFQCKDRTTIGSVEKEFASIDTAISSITSNQATIKKTKEKVIEDSDLQKIEHVIICYAFTDKLQNPDMESLVTGHGFHFWDNKAVKNYDKTSDTLGYLTKNQILKEFKISFSEQIGSWREPAVKITQKDKPLMYALGIHPALLLNMAYVYRRGTQKTDAYQRIINKDRLGNISKFLKSEESMLSNPVIIVFDKDEKIQEIFDFNEETKMLTFPTTTNCAWIIDGQHRIFGFKDHSEYKSWDEDKNNNYKIPVIAFQTLPETEQSRTFVNINYYQKRIDPSLFSDLATMIKDLKYEITWPCLLVSELNKSPPWKNMIKISEFDTNKPISISGFAKIRLLDTLLGFNKKSKEPNPYNGILYNLAPFDISKSFDNEYNQESFNKQLQILIRFFKAVKSYVDKEIWNNYKEYGLTKRECVNGLLLVLKAFLVYDKNMKYLEEYISAVDVINFENEKLLKYGRGYPAFSKIANKIIRKMNYDYGTKLKLIRKKPKKKKR